MIDVPPGPTGAHVLRVALDIRTEWLPVVYLLRLFAFSRILIAIADKNRRV